MKKFIVFAATLLVSVAAFAQETNKDADGNYQYGPYETNKFFDNWFLSIGGGANWSIDNLSKIVKFDTKSINVGSPALNLDAAVGKWIDPCFGVRFGYTGLNYYYGKKADSQKGFKGFYNFSKNDSYNRNGEKAAFAWYLHADLLWNICNQFWGYKENRFFNLSPYFSAALGYSDSGGEKANPWNAPVPGAGIGFLNQFRISNRVGLNLDLRAVAFKTKLFTGTEEGTDVLASAILGLNFNLGKYNWTRKSTTIASYVAAVAAAEAAAAAAKAEAAAAKNKYASDNDAYKALQDENDALKKKLANCGGTADYSGLFDEPIVAYFKIGKSVLSDAEKEHVKTAAKNILNHGDNVKFTLTGHADANTGTQAINEKLAAERAQYVYDLMTEMGVDGSKFSVSSEVGGPFDADELNRCVIVEKQ